MQSLSLQKLKNFNNFVNDKLSKKSISYREDIKRTLRRLDEYSISAHERARDDIVHHLAAMTSLYADEDEIKVIQGTFTG